LDPDAFFIGIWILSVSCDSPDLCIWDDLDDSGIINGFCASRRFNGDTVEGRDLLTLFDLAASKDATNIVGLSFLFLTSLVLFTSLFFLSSASASVSAIAFRLISLILF
jgi:hypothetical protein